MIHADVYSPRARAALHLDPQCGLLQMHGKPDQRVLQFDPAANAFHELEEIQFAAKAVLNDLWLVVDLGDASREREVVLQALGALASRYSRLDGVVPETHCQPPG